MSKDRLWEVTWPDGRMSCHASSEKEAIKVAIEFIQSINIFHARPTLSLIEKEAAENRQSD